MDLKDTITINERIMRLIESKYPGEFPTSYSGLDYTYYKQLEKDIEKARHSILYFDKNDQTDES